MGQQEAYMGNNDVIVNRVEIGHVGKLHNLIDTAGL